MTTHNKYFDMHYPLPIVLAVSATSIASSTETTFAQKTEVISSPPLTGLSTKLIHLYKSNIMSETLTYPSTGDAVFCQEVNLSDGCLCLFFS